MDLVEARIGESLERTSCVAIGCGWLSTEGTALEAGALGAVICVLRSVPWQ